MIEKYGTYKVYKHKLTGEIKRVPPNAATAFEKLASELDQWEEVPYDPGTIKD
ncbi:MAG: hypothetical protein H8E12_07750 [Rhodobacteraceae bacterium]|nr:hypothetical protein [Paracoccaceae bacterium]